MITGVSIIPTNFVGIIMVGGMPSREWQLLGSQSIFLRGPSVKNIRVAFIRHKANENTIGAHV